MRDSALDRLLRSAAKTEDSAPRIPFGFETRVVARAKSLRSENACVFYDSASLARRIVLAAVFVTLFSGVGAYWELSENEETGEPSTNAYAIADTAIEANIFQ